MNRNMPKYAASLLKTVGKTMSSPYKGGAVLGATGYLTANQREGETDEQFQQRRLERAAIGAGAGAFASRGVKDIMKANKSKSKATVDGASSVSSGNTQKDWIHGNAGAKTDPRANMPKPPVAQPAAPPRPAAPPQNTNRGPNAQADFINQFS